MDNDELDEDTGSADTSISRSEILSHAIRIAKSYKAQKLTLTLRQLYYRFVAEGLLPSGQKIYKRIGSVLTEARYNGDFPIDWIEDRGREVHLGDYSRTVSNVNDAEADVESMVAALPDFLINRSRWLGQETHVSVWVEKQALEGVFEGVCSGLGVGLFACKGYPSVSSLYEFSKDAYFAVNGRHERSDRAKEYDRRFTFGHGLSWSEKHTEGPKQCVVLYFGDHDPDGWEIPRSALRNLNQIMQTYDLAVPLEFQRIALNMDQINQYNPPPFEAKMTSARYRGYVREHSTQDAWELDALDPRVLQQLIRDEVGKFFDEGVHRRNELVVASLRSELRERLRG